MTPRVDLSMQQARENDPATLTDAELAAARVWCGQMAASLAARIAGLEREALRRAQTSLGDEQQLSLTLKEVSPADTTTA